MSPADVGRTRQRRDGSTSVTTCHLRKTLRQRSHVQARRVQASRISRQKGVDQLGPEPTIDSGQVSRHSTSPDPVSLASSDASVMSNVQKLRRAQQASACRRKLAQKHKPTTTSRHHAENPGFGRTTHCGLSETCLLINFCMFGCRFDGWRRRGCEFSRRER